MSRTSRIVRAHSGTRLAETLDAFYESHGFTPPEWFPPTEKRWNHQEGYQNKINDNPSVYSTGDLSNRIPCPIPYERDKDRLERVNNAIAFRSLQTNAEVGNNRPKVTDFVPETLDITNVEKLRADHVVFYNNTNGEIAAVVSKRDSRAIAFYDRYYTTPAMPYMRRTTGDKLRIMARKQDCLMLVSGGEPVYWGNAHDLREWMERPIDRRVPITHSSWLQYQEPTFLPRAYNRPSTLDLPRVSFILSLYSQVK